MTIAVSEKGKAMGDAIIFVAGIGVGSILTMFIMMVAIISDDIRREKED